jgi:hypothetical protein
VAIEFWGADDLADILIGLEDVRKELITLGLKRQEATPEQKQETNDAMVELAERWDTLANQIAHWPDKPPKEIKGG